MPGQLGLDQTQREMVWVTSTSGLKGLEVATEYLSTLDICLLMTIFYSLRLIFKNVCRVWISRNG